MTTPTPTPAARGGSDRPVMVTVDDRGNGWREVLAVLRGPTGQPCSLGVTAWGG